MRATALTYLADHRVLTLATCGAEGPWAAAVFYVGAGTTLYFLSSPASRHGRSIAENPRVAATIQEDYADWRAIRGVQLEGIATALSGAEEAAAIQLYSAKFPLTDAPLVAALAKVRWYRLTPDRLYFIDNSIAFGHRAEIPLD